MPPLLQLQKIPGMEGGKKGVCVVFWLTKRLRVPGEEKSVLGHPIA